MAKKPQVEEPDELIERCAGIDVGQAEVVVCARVPDRAGKRCRLIETFGTTVPDLLALHDWLAGLGVTHVAMESTGVYWKPVVRHEALLNRVGMKGPHLRAVAAAC